MLIDKWEDNKNFNVPDYRLRYGERRMCWAETKWTSVFHNPHDLNWKVHGNYLAISKDSQMPIYVFVFAGKPCNRSPSGWGYLEPSGSHLIKLSEDILSFKSELKKYAPIKRLYPSCNAV
jgi:hypothetical protein